MANTPPVPNMSSEFAFAWTGPEVDHFNKPELNSPLPCQHGAGCTYFGSCRFVHPGEEGTGRMVFEERVVTNEDGSTYTQAACVRLIGAAGFYRRRRAQMSWPEFCARNGIAYTPNPPRQREEDDDEEDEEGTPAPDATPAPRAPRGRQGGVFGSGRVHGERVHSSYQGNTVVQQRGAGGHRGRGGGRGRGRAPAQRQWVGLSSQPPPV